MRGGGRHLTELSHDGLLSDPMSEPERVTVSQLVARTSEAALAGYAANPAVRALVVAFPLAGGMLDALAGTAGTNIAIERLRVLIEELTGSLERLEGSKVDQDVTSDELIDAAIKATRGAIETGAREKVRTLAAALVGSTSSDRPPELDAESAIDSLVSLTPADLAFARHFTSQRGPFMTPHGLGPDPQFRMMRLQGAGLVESTPAEPVPGGSSRFWFRMTPTFWRLLELLRAGGETIG